MNQSKTGRKGPPLARRQFGFVLLCLLLCLGFLFRNGWKPGHTVFSNDGPLGAISARYASFSEEGAWSASWQDLTWLGGAGPGPSPNITNALGYVCGPLLHSKIYAPVALLFLGLSAWFCFRQWKFSPLACLLGALAASLNSDFFSTACWGVAAQPISFGLDFLALAALADETSPRRWLRVVLAGFAVGLAVMEAFDIGALFSLVVAVFVLFQAWAGAGVAAQRLVRGVVRVALVAGCAAFMAASVVTGLVSTQILGITGTQQDQRTKWERWDWATQWSLPKSETLSLIVPGLFGFRMDTPEGGSYWGACGRDPAWDRYFDGGPLRVGDGVSITSGQSSKPIAQQQIRDDGNITLPTIGEVKAAGRTPAELQQEIIKQYPQLAAAELAVAMEAPPGPIRYGGGGLYTGVLVVVIALWAVFQGLRRENSPFSPGERKFIQFWSGMALVCALLGSGRFAPFYQLFYSLPYASTIRNPSKFYHVVEWILVILFAYGVHGISRLCLDTPGAVLRGLSSHLRSWWAKAATFDKAWIIGSAIALAASLVAWRTYSASRRLLEAHLQEVRLEPALAEITAQFSIRQAGWFVVLLALALSLVALILTGYFSGRRARLGGILLGVLLVADLGRANIPWVVTWDWVRKYASNPVIDLLREKPHEQRVAILPFIAPEQLSLFNNLYEIEWKQQLFQYYNIQSLDIIMMPRVAEDYAGFEGALIFDRTTNTQHRMARRWQLTNTRYLLGAAGFLDVLNQQVDPLQHRFHIKTRFDITAKPGIPRPTGLDQLTAVINPDGQYAVFEFTGALPRAKLFANWQVSTNDQATLKELGSAEFDPARTVLVADPLSPPASGSATNQIPGTVEITGYAPKHIVLQAKADCPAVLLLNDRFHPDWKVFVDGKPEKLLRCNYVMRGVYLQVGSHAVEFRFAPPMTPLCVSAAAGVLAVLLLGYLVVGGRKDTVPDSTDARPPAKQPRPAK
ncbi:MAG TPA: polysaccharide biosynthesis/export family protein [Candidatus Paceibacterota bacterium]|nr:polysaccharide biosynthesis/export family protein [Verrucomicrobiota bacterium]HSA12062.1 polysaccharide biosynthesis/export family protein [Candidatus Paceibacterota bacterium]